MGRRGGTARRSKKAAAGLLLATLLLPAPAAGGLSIPGPGEIAIEAILPARQGDMLVCMIRARGLPDRASEETIESGLPSSLVVAFSALKPSGDEIMGSQSEIRIEPDLWEGTLVVRTPSMDHRVSTLEEAKELLRLLGPFPVMPLARSPAGIPIRLRVRLAVHPLAPAEARQVRTLFGGEPAVEGSDRREVSVGLGSLVRFFLGRQPEEDWAVAATTEPFQPAALPLRP